MNIFVPTVPQQQQPIITQQQIQELSASLNDLLYVLGAYSENNARIRTFRQWFNPISRSTGYITSGIAQYYLQLGGYTAIQALLDAIWFSLDRQLDLLLQLRNQQVVQGINVGPMLTVATQNVREIDSFIQEVLGCGQDGGLLSFLKLASMNQAVTSKIPLFYENVQEQCLQLRRLLLSPQLA
jgi:hypothetical protein